MRAKVTKRAEDEIEKATKVQERAAAADEKRQLLVLNGIEKQWKWMFAAVRGRGGVIQQRRKLITENRHLKRLAPRQHSWARPDRQGI